ncbi:MAG: GatB/YqeY domain-containing protein [Candidatus Saccharibacteria bacterium]
MSTKQRIDQDLKKAMLAGDKDKATLYRGLKSAILYAEVAKGLRDTGLPEPEVIAVLAKEAKQRQESADAFEKAGSDIRKNAELSEKEAIEQYLPKQMDENELIRIVDAVVAEKGPLTSQTMGTVISQIKTETSGKADGARIAALVKQRLNG